MRELKYQETRDFLNRAKVLDRNIRNMREELEYLQHVASGLASSGTSGERVQTTSDSTKMQNAVAKYTDLQKEIQYSIEVLADERLQILQAIHLLPNESWTEVLKLLYFGEKREDGYHYLNYTEIATKLDRSYAWVKLMHMRGLKWLGDNNGSENQM